MKNLKLSIIVASILISYQLTGQVPDSIPSPVLAFYDAAYSPNQINERAPKQTEEFGQLAGIWYCSGSMPDPLGKVDRVPVKAFWAWKYILDGYGVQDYYFQGKNEFRFFDFFKRGSSLTQLRIYDVKEKKWKIAFVTNSAGEIPGNMFGTFEASMQDGELIMEPSNQNPDYMRRIVFYEFKDNSFQWRSDNSTDQGETWKTAMRLSAIRVK